MEVIPESALVSAWMEVDKRHPLFEEGLAIVTEISKTPSEEIPLLNAIGASGTSMFMRTPEEKHIYKDILEEGAIYVDMRSNTIDTAIGAAEFTCSLAGQPQQQYINAIGIAASTNGLLSCQPIKLSALDKQRPSYQLQEDNINVRSCYGPAGAITDAHIDSALLGTVVSVWSGQKIWLTWPPSEFNLNAFAPKHNKLDFCGRPG